MSVRILGCLLLLTSSAASVSINRNAAERSKREPSAEQSPNEETDKNSDEEFFKRPMVVLSVGNRRGQVYGRNGYYHRSLGSRPFDAPPLPEVARTLGPDPLLNTPTPDEVEAMKVVYGMMEVMGAPVAGMQAPTPQLMSANPMDMMPPPIMMPYILRDEGRKPNKKRQAADASDPVRSRSNTCSQICDVLAQHSMPGICRGIVDAATQLCSGDSGSLFCHGLILSVSSSCSKMVAETQQFCDSHCSGDGVQPMTEDPAEFREYGVPYGPAVPKRVGANDQQHRS